MAKMNIAIKIIIISVSGLGTLLMAYIFADDIPPDMKGPVLRVVFGCFILIFIISNLVFLGEDRNNG